MVEAAKRCASSPNNESSQEQLKRAADHIRATTSEAVGATIKRKGKQLGACLLESVST